MEQADLGRIQSFLQGTNFNNVKNYHKNKRHLLGVINALQKEEKEKIKELIPLLDKALEKLTQAESKLPGERDTKLRKLVHFIKDKWYGSTKLGSLTQRVDTLEIGVLLSKEGAKETSVDKRREFQNEVFKTSQLAKKALAQTTAFEAQIQGRTYIITKEGRKIDILAREKLLGKGSFGEVYKVVSVKTGEARALKYAVATDIEEARANLQNESHILSVLNRAGVQEGIQEAVKVSVLSADGQEQRVIMTGKIYSQGNLGSLVGLPRVAKMLQIDQDTLLKATDSEISQIIERRLNQVKTNKEQYKSFLDEISGCLGYVHRDPPIISPEDSGFLDRQVGRDYPADDDIAKKVFETAEKTMKELSATVKEKAKTDGQVSINEKMHMGSNIVSGLLYIHKCGIIHGDIKPSNFFADGAKAVIADYGGARTKEELLKQDPSSTKDYGPGDYIDAMHAYRKNNDEENLFLCGEAFDIRATGISLYEMLTGGTIPADLIGNESSFYGKETYENMKDDMVANGIDPRAAELIAKMATPYKVEGKNFPKTFPLPVSKAEMQELAAILKGA